MKTKDTFEIARQFINASNETEAKKLYKELQSLCACQEEVDNTIMEVYENQ